MPTGNESTIFWEQCGRHPDLGQTSGSLDSNAGSLLVEVLAKRLALAEIIIIVVMRFTD